MATLHRIVGMQAYSRTYAGFSSESTIVGESHVTTADLVESTRPSLAYS